MAATPVSADRPAPSSAIIPAVVIDPVTPNLLAAARFTATNYEHMTGHPITAADLGAHLSVSDAVAADILHRLGQENPNRVNGHHLTTTSSDGVQ